MAQELRGQHLFAEQRNLRFRVGGWTCSGGLHIASLADFEAGRRRAAHG